MKKTTKKYRFVLQQILLRRTGKVIAEQILEMEIKPKDSHVASAMELLGHMDEMLLRIIEVKSSELTIDQVRKKKQEAKEELKRLVKEMG